MRDDDGQLTYRSADCRFGLSIPSSKMKMILDFCAQADRKETGGILLGRYTSNQDMALITEIAGPPSDSTHGNTFFVRGVRGLQRLLNQVWRRKEYYLGEWHYHPFAAAGPSGTDDHQMLEFADNKRLNCPEPVLLVVGGDPKRDWQVKVLVYTRNRETIELSPVQINS